MRSIYNAWDAVSAVSNAFGWGTTSLRKVLVCFFPTPCPCRAAMHYCIISHLRAVVSNSEVYRVLQVLNGGMPPESVGAVNGNKNVQPSVPNSAAITFVDPAVGGPSVLFFMGANGMGKTTTVGKVASRLREEGGQKVLLAAADTFRWGIGCSPL